MYLENYNKFNDTRIIIEEFNMRENYVMREFFIEGYGHFFSTTVFPISSYSTFDIHNCWNVPYTMMVK